MFKVMTASPNPLQRRTWIFLGQVNEAMKVQVGGGGLNSEDTNIYILQKQALHIEIKDGRKKICQNCTYETQGATSKMNIDVKNRQAPIEIMGEGMGLGEDMMFVVHYIRFTKAVQDDVL